jgi:hypothetical protein
VQKKDINVNERAGVKLYKGIRQTEMSSFLLKSHYSLGRNSDYKPTNGRKNSDLERMWK